MITLSTLILLGYPSIIWKIRGLKYMPLPIH